MDSESWNSICTYFRTLMYSIIDAIGGSLQMMPGECGQCLTSPGTGWERSQVREGDERGRRVEDRGRDREEEKRRGALGELL